MGETNVLFSIGPLEVTGAVVTMWVIVAVLALLSWLATRRLRDVPGPLQNAAEMAVEKLQGFYGGILGPANARRYFPMMATFFIFIVVSNYIGLLPGAGEVFTVPTATLSVTAGLAIIAFCMTHTVGIQRRGQLDAAAQARSDAQRRQSAAADALLAEAKSASERKRAQTLQAAHQEAAQAMRDVRARVRSEETAAAAAVDAKLPELVTALTGGLLGSDTAERSAAQIRQWVAPTHEG